MITPQYTSQERIEIITRLVPYLDAHLLTKDQLVTNIKKHVPLASDEDIERAFELINVNSLFN